MIHTILYYAGIAIVATGAVLTVMAILNNVGVMPW